MEAIILTAATIANLFFSEAAKEGGKSLGAGASKMVSQLIMVVRNKFKVAGTEGLLTRTEKQPTEANLTKVKEELEIQLQEDEGFATELKNLLGQLEAAGVVRQVMAKGIEISGNFEAKNMTQEASRGGSVEQEMLTEVKAQNIIVDDMNQKI